MRAAIRGSYRGIEYEVPANDDGSMAICASKAHTTARIHVASSPESRTRNTGDGCEGRKSGNRRLPGNTIRLTAAPFISAIHLRLGGQAVAGAVAVAPVVPEVS